MSNAYFITGTDTGVGKTLVATALLKLARDRGLNALGLKPVSAGTTDHDGVQANEDAWQLMRGSSKNPDYQDVNPVALPEPMAPHIAAQREGRELSASALASHCKPLIAGADFTVIEGAGGWDVPLNATDSMADLAAQLDCPVIMVVGIRLGCLNHALLTASAIKSRGLQLSGWVANRIDPDMPVADENIDSLAARLPAPLLGSIPWAANPDPDALAGELNFAALLA